MASSDYVIVGGGAVGMFTAAMLAEVNPLLQIVVFEKAANPLAKVRVSGGGRCNLTHACSDLHEFVKNYPRGGRELIGPLTRFGSAETQAWFESHGVPLVTLSDGSVFPQSDTSEDVIRTLLDTAARGQVKIQTCSEVSSVRKISDGFDLQLASGIHHTGRKLLISTGGGAVIEGLGHTVEPCVPSLFTFNTPDRDFTALAGIVAGDVQVHAPGLCARGALLITHGGVSGPAVLRLSSFGARVLAEWDYRFEMKINWLPTQSEEQLFQTLEWYRGTSPRKQVGTWSPVGLSSRLWKLLVARADVDETLLWGGCPLKALRRIAEQIHRFSLPISGKNRHREEFVTCGGIRLAEVNFKTMESRRIPGLYFAGEVLDIDGLTGGFNLQAAWTTGYLAAQALLTG